MLNKDSRLRLTEISCRIKLCRPVTLEERVWVNKLCETSEQAKGIYERFTC